MARWVGESLELSSTSSTGWWKNGTPEEAGPGPTDFRMRLAFTRGTSDNDELLLRVTLSDEKGELDYRFHRVLPGLLPAPGN
jgi:hypothetical protein